GRFRILEPGGGNIPAGREIEPLVVAFSGAGGKPPRGGRIRPVGGHLFGCSWLGPGRDVCGIDGFPGWGSPRRRQVSGRNVALGSEKRNPPFSSGCESRPGR